MAEPDAFETRFAAAYRAFLDGAPTDVDAVAIARAAAAAHPRSRVRAPVWALGPARAFAWFVLLALLLATLGAAALWLGSHQAPRLPALVAPISTAISCPPGSTPDAPGPIDQARPVGLSGLTLDRRAGKLVALTATPAGTETWTFDLCSNTWAQMHPGRQPSGIDGGQLVYDVDSGVTLGVIAGRVWAYDLEADSWTPKGVAPTDRSLVAYDPITGLVMATGDAEPNTVDVAELWSYDVATDTWASIRQTDPPAAADHGVAFAYDASVDRMIAYAVYGFGGSGNETWSFDLRDHTWTKADADTPTIHGLWGMATTPPAIAYDEAAALTVVVGMGRSAAYDATADRWQMLSGGVARDQDWLRFGPASQWSPEAYDPLNERLVGLGDAGSVWGFDPLTRRWTVLLEAMSSAWPTEDGSFLAASPRPGWVPELEAMLPSDVNGVTFTKTSIAGDIPSTRLGTGGWGTVPLDADRLSALFEKSLADLSIAIATPTDASRAGTFAIAFRVRGLDPAELGRGIADMSGVGPGVAASVGGRQVQSIRETGGMGFDLYVKGDVLFYIFTDGTPLVDGIVGALP